MSVRRAAPPNVAVAALVEQEAPEIVCEIDEPDLRVGASLTTGVDKPAHPVLLMREDMLDAGADSGFEHAA